MPEFKKILNDKASELSQIPIRQIWDKSIPGTIKREIALTVNQISQLKRQHEEQFLKLLRIECDVTTDLMQLERRMPRYAPYHFPEKEKFKQRLFEIEKERQNLNLRLNEKTQGLEDKLLSLINQHEKLD